MRFNEITDEELREIVISDLSEKQLQEFIAELLMRILLKVENGIKGRNSDTPE